MEWCNRFVSFGVGYALSWSGGSSCWVGWGVSRDLGLFAFEGVGVLCGDSACRGRVGVEVFR